MTNIISSHEINRQLQILHKLQETNVADQPLLLQVSESLYAIGQPDRKQPDNLHVTLTTNSMEIVPQTKYDPNGWVDDITTDAPLFQFEDGYLVLTESGYQFTPHMFKLGCNDPISPNVQHTDIEISLLLSTESLTMTTQKYQTLTVTPSEWEQLNKKSLSEIVNELLNRGINKQTYDTNETESDHSKESILLIDGQEQNVWLDESAREQLKEYSSDQD